MTLLSISDETYLYAYVLNLSFSTSCWKLTKNWNGLAIKPFTFLQKGWNKYKWTDYIWLHFRINIPVKSQIIQNVAFLAGFSCFVCFSFLFVLLLFCFLFFLEVVFLVHFLNITLDFNSYSIFTFFFSILMLDGINKYMLYENWRNLPCGTFIFSVKKA